MIGAIALSKAGRDKGKYFVIVGIVDEAYVLIADGKYHRIDHPKKKKLKHLAILPFKSENIYGKIKGIEFLQDKQLQNYMQEFLNQEGGVEKRVETGRN